MKLSNIVDLSAIIQRNKTERETRASQIEYLSPLVEITYISNSSDLVRLLIGCSGFMLASWPAAGVSSTNVAISVTPSGYSITIGGQELKQWTGE